MSDASDPEHDLGVETDRHSDVEPLSTSTYKVRGKLDAPGGTGVLGHNTATSGAAHGVLGQTQSDSEDAAGVRGTTRQDGATQGVAGYAVSDPANELGLGLAAGVYGETDWSDRYGVCGRNISQAGRSYGVLGRTLSFEGAGVLGSNGAGGPAIEAAGFLAVQEYVDIEEVGVSAYRSENQPMPGDGTEKTVEFDETNRDDFTGYDEAAGVYTVREAGDYHVEFLINWIDSFSSGDFIGYQLRLNGSVTGGLFVTKEVPSSTQPTHGFSRTLYGLEAGDTLELTVDQNSGSPKRIFGSSDQPTYLTVTKVGGSPDTRVSYASGSTAQAAERIETLEAANQLKEERIQTLEDRLAAVEDRLATMEAGGTDSEPTVQ